MTWTTAAGRARWPLACVLAVGVWLPWQAPAAPQPESSPTASTVRTCDGKAWRLDDGKHFYDMRVRQRWQGGVPRSSETTWTDPEGKVFARQSLEYGATPFMPVIRFSDLRRGVLLESAPAPGGKARVSRREGTGKPLESKLLSPSAPVVGTGAIDAFLRANWARIDAGEKVAFSLVAPSRLDWYRFRVRRLGEDMRGKRRVVRVVLEPDSWALRAFAGQLVLSVDPEAGHAVAFQGRDRIADADGEPVKVRTRLHCTPRPGPAVAPTPSGAGPASP